LQQRTPRERHTQGNPVNSQQKPQSVSELLEDLDAGVFAQKVTTAVAEAALGVVHTGKKGKVVLTFDLARIGDANQVQLTHGLKYVKPTSKGKVIEEDTTSTPLHVGPRGHLTLFPASQQSLDFAGMASKSEA
jgi:hypothetical protein